MLVSLCSERLVEDCEFFINKRDFPQLKRNLSEPYDFLYDKNDEPLVKKVPMYAQAKFKYHVYVDGHCAAMRYASMMPLGAVILKVSSSTKLSTAAL